MATWRATRYPGCRRGTRVNHARPVQVSRGSEGDASGVAVELPTAEIGRWRVLANCRDHPEARVQRHGSSLTTVQTFVPKPGAWCPPTDSCDLWRASAQRVASSPRCTALRRAAAVPTAAPSPTIRRDQSARPARTRSPRQRRAAAARLPSSRVVGGALAGRGESKSTRPLGCAKSGGCLRTSLVNGAVS